MAALSQSPPSHRWADGRMTAPRSGDLTSVESRLAFRGALTRYKGSRLAAIRLAQGAAAEAARIRTFGNIDEIVDYLDSPSAVEALLRRLDIGSRLALCLFALTETTSHSFAGLTHALGMLGAEPTSAIVRLLELGLLVIEPNPELSPVDDFQSVFLRVSPGRLRLRVHPSVANGIRTARPELAPPKVAGPVGQVRESDGLEPILRLGALWQRVGAEPLRQTIQGTLYKRDRDRIADDPVLLSPIADALKPITRSPELWLELACRVGLVEPDSSGERILAAAPEFWTDNAVHLPQMIATKWLGLETWQELESTPTGGTASLPALPYLRIALLLWLSALDLTEWAALDDLAAQLSERLPAWDRLSFADEADASIAAQRTGAPPPGRVRNRIRSDGSPRGVSVLESVLLGAAYPLGLVRAGTEQGSGHTVVQLTPLARYVLALGPTPPPRATFEQFLFVQPNFEVIAYRQGLTPQLVGRLSRFAWWSQIGAALELKLTRESIVLGLDGELTPEAILQTLTLHSQRALPAGVTDAVTNWASRRERVTYYAAATLIEFGSSSERDLALANWPVTDLAAPIAVAERFLLVEDEKTVPFDRLRLISSRDYRRPPEICVLVEPDGVTMTLDPSRSDLLVEAELARFAEVLSSPQPEPALMAPTVLRRFAVSAASLRRATNRGMTSPQLVEWYTRRTGGEIPPAVRLLLAARTSRVPILKAVRMLILNLPTAELLDGLLQHPTTSPWLGDRLGPTAVAIADDRLAPLQNALKDLGIDLKAV
jgi:hypothetical protein